MAKQAIRHGATIDAATPDEVAQIVAGFSQAQDEQYRREKGNFQLDATGAGQAALDIPGQHDWILERITATAGSGGLIELFENSTSNLDLLEQIQLPNNGVYSDAFANKIFVPSLSRLLIVCTGGGPNGVCTFNLQIRMIKHH